ncbi:probable LRR receptor-like serine/threonine-protein kinase At3g47570 isoform X2 [Magnolia sinica]|uniref:probable LRR receptor-like serine/threonine-protein kinase At3g47570 isoform X2 n=1 Tax=Magnolia sinica TaxID=86752 RepID=UPI0026594135|nr:probable LRR receptor-like serine/threonine-protein kinase At3g47570 isoform X2 [Magnolia sinica]
MVECEALRNIWHWNLVKIVTACSSIDFKGNDFKALAFEYMPNGSLEKWLHPSVHWNQELWSWNLIQRLDIAIDVASALEYLHHHCHISVIHRDLKPSNVLLDDDMRAHVGDFGLARFLSNAATNTSQDQTSSAGIKGSVGYVPPGKRPTDDMFKDGLSLHEFAKMALPDQVMRIADPSLLLEEVRATYNNATLP